MQLSGFLGGFYRISEWVFRLAYINLLWILFSVLGIIVFGFFPATIAMFAMTRKWIMGDTNFPIFKTFWKYYKNDFLKSNLLGFIVSIIGFILYVDIQFIENTSQEILKITYIPLLIISFIYIVGLFYVFPVFVHYQISLIQVIKSSFLLMLVNPLQTILMLIGLLIYYYVMLTLPGLLTFFSGSGLSLLFMGCAYYAFEKNKRKLEKMVEE